jgi:hypothetical protein
MPRGPVIALEGLAFVSAAAAAVLLSPSAGVARDSASPIATATCDSSIEVDPPPRPGPRDRVVLNRVWVAGRDRVAAPSPQPSGRPPFVYFAKTGLSVRRGSVGALVELPVAWRDRVAIAWGDAGSASRIRFLPCRFGPSWISYAGGFSFRDKSGGCVPLRVTVGASTRVVLFGVGRAC